MADRSANLPGPEAGEPLGYKTAPNPSDRLDSWKEIAAYLKRGIRTVQRWERQEGLPVRRVQHDERANVFAYKTELDAWLRGGHALLEAEDEEERKQAPETVASASALEHGSGRARAGNDEQVAQVRPRRHRRMWYAGAAMAAVVLASTAIYFLRPRAASALHFQSHDVVLIASFENRTGDPLFDGTMEAALGRELANSRFVSVAPRVRINDTLALMRKPASTRIDASLGREICLRDGGIQALITGRIEKFGSTYALSAELVDPSSGRTVASFEQDAGSQNGVLAAVHRISNQLRQSLGEKLSEIHRSDLALQKVTTPSLRALQLYSQANQALQAANAADDRMTFNTDERSAFDLLKQAIAEDPKFASAYILAAWSLHNIGKPPEEYLSYAKRAIKLSGQASAPERYFIEGSYYQMSGQPDRAVAAYQALLRVDPGNFWGMQNLASLGEEYSPQDAVEVSVRLAKLRPNDYNANWLAGYQASITGDRPALAGPYFQRARAIFSAMDDRGRDGVADRAIWLQLLPAYRAWMKNDVAAASEKLRRVEQAPVASDDYDNPRDFGLFSLTLGQTRKAREWFRRVSATGDPADQQFYDLNFALLAFVCEDHAALRADLRRTARLPGTGWMAVYFMIQEGLFQDAKAEMDNDKNTNPSFDLDNPLAKLAKGDLLVAMGNTAEGMPLLREGVAQTLNKTNMAEYYFLGAEILARDYERQGHTPAALQVLEDASANRPRVNIIIAMIGAPFWMRDRMDLARLYRRLGRVQDAEKIENELRKLLADADPNFPMLVELKKLQDTSSMASKTN